MANDCLPQVQACRIRVARLEAASGVPLPGANNLYVSNALATLGFAWEVEAGDSILEKNACGEALVDYEAPANVRRGNLTIRLLTPDPQLSELLSAGEVLTSGAAVGYGAPPLGLLGDDVISIEVWTKRIRNRKLDSAFPYGWWVYPWVTNLRPDDHEHNNGNLPMQFIGEAYENENWADGPLNDWPTTSDRVYQWIPTTDLPDDVCGYQAIAAT